MLPAGAASVTRRATIERLRADLDAAHRDMWAMAMENITVAVECKRLQAIVDRQDGTILALWSLIEQAEKEKAP